VDVKFRFRGSAGLMRSPVLAPDRPVGPVTEFDAETYLIVRSTHSSVTLACTGLQGLFLRSAPHRMHSVVSDLGRGCAERWCFGEGLKAVKVITDQGVSGGNDP
jgi:hypothetical protein